MKISMTNSDDESSSDAGPLPQHLQNKRATTDNLSSSDEGPVPLRSLAEENPKKKKRKILQNAEMYLKNIPSAAMYERSFQHKEALKQVIVSEQCQFLITASVEGVLKFWKKRAEGIEWVKEYRSHGRTLLHMCLSHDGMSLATVGLDSNKSKNYMALLSV